MINISNEFIKFIKDNNWLIFKPEPPTPGPVPDSPERRSPLNSPKPGRTPKSYN